MRTEHIPVADGVELAVDLWSPAPPERVSGDGRTAPGDRASEDPAATGPSDPAPFVLAHGLASNARLWDGVAERLGAAGHLVATVDLRGHGRSSKPDGPYDVPTVADDLATLIAGLSLDRPIVAGQSWGGNVAVELAARHPETIRGIVCVDGGWFEPSKAFPDWESCRTALAPPRLVGRRLAEVEGYIRSAHPDWPEAGIQGTLANFEIRPDGTVAPWLTYEHHIEVLHGMWEHHPFRAFPRLSVPALLVPAEGGPSDRAELSRREVEAARAAIPRSRVAWLRGDHDIHAQHPDEVADLMLAATRDGFFA